MGAGVQSSALLIMSDRGDCGIPKADVAVFADTQDEPKWVYENVERLRSLVSIPIVTVTKGQLSQAGSRSFVPFFTQGGGMTRRKCTSEFKIGPIQKWARVNGATAKKPFTAMLGITVDEAHRMKPSLVKYIENTYPLVNAALGRLYCVHYFERLGLPVPQKSACVFCPYHSDSYWKSLKQNAPEEWARAVEYDERIRDSRAAGIKHPCYLHKSEKPLAEVDLQENQMEFFGNECAGVCGV